MIDPKCAAQLHMSQDAPYVPEGGTFADDGQENLVPLCVRFARIMSVAPERPLGVRCRVCNCVLSSDTGHNDEYCGERRG